MGDEKRKMTEDELETMDRYAREDIEAKSSTERVKRSSRIRRLVEEMRRARDVTSSGRESSSS